MKYAYIRVSTADQCVDRQLDALADYDIDEIFLDRASGKNFDRPAYQRMLDVLKKGDLLIIKSIDRLGRNYEEIQDQWRFLTKEIGVQMYVLDMPLLDTRIENDLMASFVANIVLQILSFVAETERTSIRQRQQEGIAAAKARGVRFGRPKTTVPAGFDKAVEQWRSGVITMETMLEHLSLSRSTFYRILHERQDSTPSVSVRRGRPRKS